MIRRKIYCLLLFACIQLQVIAQADDRFLSYSAKPSQIELHWKDDNGNVIGSIGNLKTFFKATGDTLLFAMNGGMYSKDQSPQGLYIEKGKTLAPLDTLHGNGNFYLKPNGIFYLTTTCNPIVCTTENFQDNGQIKFATQSGPMLVIDGQIHGTFKKGSTNLNIRNGVGILSDGNALFAISKVPVNFYDFAMFFKNQKCNTPFIWMALFHVPTFATKTGSNWMVLLE